MTVLTYFKLMFLNYIQLTDDDYSIYFYKCFVILFNIRYY